MALNPSNSSSFEQLALKGLKLTNCSFQYATRFLWNHLTDSIRQPLKLQSDKRSDPGLSVSSYSGSVH